LVRKGEQGQPSVVGKERKIFVKNRKEGQIKNLAKKRKTVNIKFQGKIKTQQIQ
jgi:hypothetical protein